MSAVPSRAAVALALVAVAAVLVVPVGAMLVRSFLAKEVHARDGTVYAAVGEVEETERGVRFYLQASPGAEREAFELLREDVTDVRTVFTLENHAQVLGDARTRALLRNSLTLASGAVLVALLLGLPLAWLLSRTDLPGRRVLWTLALAPAILPPFFVAMGSARAVGTFLADALGLSGEALQTVNGMVLFGSVLFPFVTVLTARALSAVPAGPWEAARLLGGRGAAFRHVTLPAVLPAVLGSSVLVLAMALSDFAVPDLLSFILPRGASGVPVFAKEIQIQWANVGNHARAVATGTPLLLATAALLVLSLRLLARSPLAGPAGGVRPRERVALPAAGRVAAWLSFAAVFAFAVALPIAGIASWALGAGETAASGTAGGPAASAPAGRLLDFAGAIDRTPGVGRDWLRWVKTALAATVLTTFVAVVLGRLAARGGRTAKGLVLALAGLSLATPGLVLSVGTLLLSMDAPIPGFERGTALSVLALTGRLFPYGLLAAWLAMREVPRGLEEAGTVLGAGASERATRIWLPLSMRGILVGALLVFLLALKEIDAVVLIEPQIFPLRLYDKVHYSRMADEANLTILYLLHLLLPALLVAGFLALRRGTDRARQVSPGGRS